MGVIRFILTHVQFVKMDVPVIVGVLWKQNLKEELVGSLSET